jgi:murein DD-endopeptidase MepM/ murein hydrolase activator NlpD
MDLSQLPSQIFGIHDASGTQILDEAGKRGWIVLSVQVGDGSGDFSGLANAGHVVIVRLNHGYGSAGTIPFSSQFAAFAQACGGFVAGSRGAHIWIIGNETNLQGERPGNGSPQEEAITPESYAHCFAQCRAAIKQQPGHEDDWVVPAPPGPWNNQTAYPGNPAGDWALYFRDILNECLKRGAPADALALHTYTAHDVPMEAGLIETEDRFPAPFQERHFQFRAYRDFLSVVPTSLRSVPVFITESQHLPWEDRDVGWIQRAYAEINAWNADTSHQPIQAVCLFRWQRNEGDPEGWSISNRGKLRNDFRAALQNNYPVRWLAAKPPPVIVKPDVAKVISPTRDILPLEKARWFIEEAVRKLEANDGAGAREILVKTVTPWFYASAPEHSGDLEKAQAHTTARFFSEEATRRIEEGKLNEARELLLQNVLPWLTSTGPRAMGILGLEQPEKKKRPRRKRRGAAPVEFGTLGIGEAPIPAAPPAPKPTLAELLVAAADARQLIHFNNQAALQKRMFEDGLVPNSDEFDLPLRNLTYKAQRAEHLLTGEVRVYYAPTTNFNDVRFVLRGGTRGPNTPFKGGNRITQRYAERPEFYAQFGLAGHEGLDLVPRDGDRDIYCVEEGVVITDVDVPGDPKKNAYGIYVIVYNRGNKRLWYYCHMSENMVAKDQAVRSGDKLGRMGGTGNVQGDHLHLNLKPLNDKSLPRFPQNGFKGYADPEPLLNAINAADTPAELRDALLAKAEASQVISFNTQAALQKSMYGDGLCPNSLEFNLTADGTTFVAQRAEDLDSGEVRVYYAPTTDFNDVKFVKR